MSGIMPWENINYLDKPCKARFRWNELKLCNSQINLQLFGKKMK